MQNFITGSQAYGIPHEGSDIDLVCLLSREEIVRLSDLSDNPLDDSKLGYCGCTDREYFGAFCESFNLSLRFGKLNLICTSSIAEFNVWKVVTDELVSKKPVTREYAVSRFAQVRAAIQKEDLEIQKKDREVKQPFSLFENLLLGKPNA